MPPTLRPATQADRTAVETIVHDAYVHYVARIGRKPGPMLDDYAGLIAEGRVHLAEQDGAAQGVLVLIPQDAALLLDNIAVAPAAQGSGVGRRLLEFAEQAARDAGYSAIVLYTHEAMTENLALYTRIGYAETHRVEEKGFRRVYMRKKLS